VFVLQFVYGKLINQIQFAGWRSGEGCGIINWPCHWSSQEDI